MTAHLAFHQSFICEEGAALQDGRFIVANRPEGATRIIVTLPAAPGARSARKAG